MEEGLSLFSQDGCCSCPLPCAGAMCLWHMEQAGIFYARIQSLEFQQVTKGQGSGSLGSFRRSNFSPLGWPPSKFKYHQPWLSMQFEEARPWEVGIRTAVQLYL